MYSSSGFGVNSERENTVQTNCTFCGGTNDTAKTNLKGVRQEKEKACATAASDNRRTERTPWKKFICGSEDYLVVKFPKPPKDSEKRRKQQCFNGKCNRA